MFIRLLLFAGVALSLCAQTARRPIFVSPDQLEVAPILGNPPAAGSERSKAELAELHHLQQTRSEADMKLAKSDDAEEDIFIFQNVLGPRFNRELLPLTAVLSEHVHNDEGIIVNPAKQFFQRPRPFNFDSTVKPICKTTTNPTDFSYPSGHSVTGYLEAFTLMMIVPEKRDAILARADEYAHNRLVCGVHYPSDIVASKSVAYAMIALMETNPQFKKELEAARAEARRVLFP